MLRKTLAVAALAMVTALGVAPAASARTEPDQPGATPVFFFGSQGLCVQAGMVGQTLGLLPSGGWSCQNGLMTTSAAPAGSPGTGSS